MKTSVAVKTILNIIDEIVIHVVQNLHFCL